MIMRALYILFNFSTNNVHLSKDFSFQFPFQDLFLRRSRTVINGFGYPSVRTKTKLSYSSWRSSISNSGSNRPYKVRKIVMHSSRNGGGGTRNVLSTTSNTYSYEMEAVYDVLQRSVAILRENDVPEPALSSCHLLSYALNLPPSNGFSYLLRVLEQDQASNTNNNQHLSQRQLTQEEARNFQLMLQRRLHHEPIQYIIGEWDFYDFTLKCRAPILCPRPETEELVEWVHQCIIQYQKNQHQKDQAGEALSTTPPKLRILDVGCGTGAIGLALARLLPGSEVVAIDTSQDAVNLSMENYASLQLDNSSSSSVRYQAICCSARDFTNRRKNDHRGENAHHFEFDIVVSNPPYIPAADMHTLTRDVIQYESYDALYGGSDDGMGVIRDIIKQIPEWTNNSQLGIRELFMEVDTSHPPKIAQWLNSSRNDMYSSTLLPAFFVESRKDFSGRDRFVRLQANRHFLY